MANRPVVLAAANFEGRGFTDMAALDVVLDELDAKFRAAEDPSLVTVAESLDLRVAIAVGDDQSVISFVDETDGYYVSHNGKADDGTTVRFGSRNTVSEFSTSNLVPIAEAREAVRRFFVTRRRPDNIMWQGVG